MVVDTTYYDWLQVSTDCDGLAVKKAYRRLAIIFHSDKNPDDPDADQKFQQISEAYQVLSNDDLRKKYDKFGRDKAVPDAGFEDANDFFSMIFGGDAFVDLIGEISLMKDMLKTADITMAEEQAQAEKEAADPSTSKVENVAQPGPLNHLPDKPTTSSTPSSGRSTPGTSTPREPRPQITAHGEDEKFLGPSGMTEEEKNIRKAEKKKGGLSKEQRAKLDELEQQRQEEREIRVEALTQKLRDRLSVWTEAETHDSVTEAFRQKTIYEAESLKMESFGIELLHTIGFTYMQKGNTFLKSQKFLGISGFFSKVKEKGTFMKETWGTISAALDAQMVVEDMAKKEEKGEEMTDVEKAEFERRLTGKVLNAAWQASRYEIQSILREVCDKVIHDKSISMSKRIQRAQGLMLVGSIFSAVHADPDEAEDARVFESLLAEAQQKKNKKEKRESKHKPPNPLKA